MMLLVVLPLLACFQGLWAVQWSSAYRNTTTLCPGHNLIIGGDYRLEAGETVEDIKWLFAPGSGQPSSIIASYMAGFFNSAPSYGTRLTHLSNGKVVLATVTSADDGTYTTEVITRRTTGSFSTIRRHLVVTVADPSVYSSNVLSVKMVDQAVPDAHGNLHFRLTCGPLAWRGEPPVDVIWTTPSEAKLNSTGYENDYFYLMLDNQVVSGVYACRLPASGIPALCLRDGDPLTRQATLQVDTIAARLALLEANNINLTQQLKEVKADNINLTQQLKEVKVDNINLTQQLKEVKVDNINLTQRVQQLERDSISLTQELQDVKGDLTHQLQQVRTEQDQCREDVGNNTRLMKLLEDDFNQYRNISSTHVGFHAWLGSDVALAYENIPVKFSHIYYNDGGAYDKSTGQFTAPVEGTYFFVFTTFAYQRGHTGDSHLLVDGTDVAWVFTNYSDYINPATGHAVLHLEKGRGVWLETWGYNQQFDHRSQFSGFLIRSD